MKAKKVKIELEEYLMLKEFYQKNTGERMTHLWINWFGKLDEHYEIIGVDESFKKLTEINNETTGKYKNCENNLNKLRSQLSVFKNMNIFQFIIYKLKNTNKV